MRHLIKIALVLLAGVAAYFVYGFTALVAHPLFAVLAAGSLVGTYIGLAFARMPASQQHRARTVAQGAMVIEAIYGTLYVLHVQSPHLFAPPLPIWLSVPLAVLHGAAFSILAYFVSLFVVHERVEDAPAPDATTLLGVLVQELRQLPAPQIAPQVAYPPPEAVREDTANARPASINAGPQVCPKCSVELERPQWLAARRWGYCKACKEA